MADVEFREFTAEVQNTMNSKIRSALEEVAGELVSKTKRNSRVDTGKTKNSFRYGISRNFADGSFTAHIGSSDENAIWEELGTGEHALDGKGRKGAWYVPVEKVTGKKKPTFNGKVVKVYGKGGKVYYKTNGKEPHRPFWRAFESLKPKIIKRLQNALKGM